MEKNKKIQILRGLAILAVVFIHTGNGGMCQVFCRPFINFAVGMFLFLSGYLTKIDRSDWYSLFIKRISKVLIPYVIWSVLYSLPHTTPKDLIVNLITARSSAMLYYIFVYIQFVLLTPLLGKLAKGKAQWVGWLVAPLSVLVFKYYWLLTGTHLNKYVSIAWGVSCLGWFTYYYLGLILGNGLLKKILPLRTVLVLWGLSFLLQMLEGYWWLLLGDNNCGTQIKLSSFLTTSLFLVISYYYLTEERIKLDSKVLLYLGDYSFGIFFIHMMMIRALKQVPLYNCVPFPVSSIIVLFVSFWVVYFGKKILGERISRWIGFV